MHQLSKTQETVMQEVWDLRQTAEEEGGPGHQLESEEGTKAVRKVGKEGRMKLGHTEQGTQGQERAQRNYQSP
jgi:hypothetical protein